MPLWYDGVTSIEGSPAVPIFLSLFETENSVAITALVHLWIAFIKGSIIENLISDSDSTPAEKSKGTSWTCVYNFSNRINKLHTNFRVNSLCTVGTTLAACCAWGYWFSKQFVSTRGMQRVWQERERARAAISPHYHQDTQQWGRERARAQLMLAKTPLTLAHSASDTSLKQPNSSHFSAITIPSNSSPHTQMENNKLWNYLHQHWTH